LLETIQTSSIISHISSHGKDFVHLQTNSSVNPKPFSGLKLNLTPNIRKSFEQKRIFQKPWKISNTFNCSHFRQIGKAETFLSVFKQETKLEVEQFQRKQNYEIRHKKDKAQSNNVFTKNQNKSIRKGLETLQYLLRMQNWPGVPKISGVCIKGRENDDITNREIDYIKAEANTIK